MKKLLFLSTVLMMSCTEKNDYTSIATTSKSGNYVAVIEIPSGTNKKIEYNPQSNKFEMDKKDGVDRVIEFLPYLGNYGFIPSTLSDTKQGGDGDPIDVLVLTEALKTGDVIEILPLALFKLMDENQEDFKIIAVPKDQNLNVLNVTTYEELGKKHPVAVEILKLWFTNYDTDKLQIMDIVSETEALEYIENNRIQK